MSEKMGPIYDPRDYAGFLRRSAALVIDLVILGLAGFVTPWLWYFWAPDAWVTEEAYAWIWIVWLLASLAYLVGFRLTARGTPGYRIVGIRYAYMLAGEPSWTNLAFRAVMAVFLLWFFLLDHFWILVDERKQAWHDKVSGFYVVKRGAAPIGTQRIVRRVIQFMMLTFEVWEPAKEGTDRPPPG